MRGAGGQQEPEAWTGLATDLTWTGSDGHPPGEGRESGGVSVTTPPVLPVALLNWFACWKVFSRVRNGETRD